LDNQGIVTSLVRSATPRTSSWQERKKEPPMTKALSSTLQVLMSGLGIGESPRWRDGRLWFCNWGAQEVIAVDPAGRSEVMLNVPTTLPFSIDWLPDGRLLAVSGPEGLLLVQQPDGSLATYADLSDICGGCNELVVDGRGNAYVNGGRFNPMAGGAFEPGSIAVAAPGGVARKVADGIEFPNGMAVTADNGTLIIAESYGRRLTAFDIAADGGLANRRVWADLGEGAPDGICVDDQGAVWYADVPNRRCVRVREGGEVLASVEADRGCFACMLGGADRRTLFIVAAQWQGMDKIVGAPLTGQVLTAQAPAPAAGWP
jgi:sugar lactone lactonase YvrE